MLFKMVFKQVGPAIQGIIRDQTQPQSTDVKDFKPVARAQNIAEDSGAGPGDDFFYKKFILEVLAVRRYLAPAFYMINFIRHRIKAPPVSFSGMPHGCHIECKGLQAGVAH